MTTDYDADGYADFSDDRKPVRFSAQGQRYECFPALAIGTTQKVAHIADDLEDGDVLGSLKGFFDLVMDPDSAARLYSQLADQSPGSLTTDQGVKIMHFVMERYGLRPLEQSSD